LATVLIVDDEPLVVKLLARVLVEAGYETLTCDSGKAALEVIAEYDGPLDIVLTDIRMPGVSGWAVASAAKKRWPWAGTVYISGDRAMAQEHSCTPDDCFLQKPFSALSLLAAVARVQQCEAMNVA
jgi:CheY-like chemotaxis protein